tara:strand:- start:167055 stop:167777 length:723 start_codon:yes stop_codon:yes gene_type:complete
MSGIDKLRRRLLATFGLGFGASAVAGSALAASSKVSGNRLEVEIDVAVLGHTNYDNEEGAHNRDPDYAAQVKDPKKFREAYKKSDLRGSSFYHEGLIYPAGTISKPKDGRDVNWDFDAEPIGTFFDRGWAIINNRSDGPYVARPDPHLLSHTDYYLGGVVGPDNLTPPDMIATVGLQHNDGMSGQYLRAVVGGTGKYATVSGQMVQTPWGNNSSILQGRFLPEGAKPPSPNFRIKFELYL